MSKYLYSYSIVHKSGRVIYANDPSRARARRLLVDLTASGIGRQFRIQEHRQVNPAYHTAAAA